MARPEPAGELLDNPVLAVGNWLAAELIASAADDCVPELDVGAEFDADGKSGPAEVFTMAGSEMSDGGS